MNTGSDRVVLKLGDSDRVTIPQFTKSLNGTFYWINFIV